MLNGEKNPNSKKSINQIEITEIMLDNNSEFYLNMKPKTIKAENMKKIKFYQDYGQINEKKVMNFFILIKYLEAIQLNYIKSIIKRKKR